MIGNDSSGDGSGSDSDSGNNSLILNYEGLTEEVSAVGEYLLDKVNEYVSTVGSQPAVLLAGFIMTLAQMIIIFTDGCSVEVRNNTVDQVVDLLQDVVSGGED